MDSSPRRPRRFSRWQTTKRTFVLGGIPNRGEKKKKLTEEGKESQVLEERIHKDPLGFQEATDLLQSSKTRNSQDADETRHIPVIEYSEEESNHSSKENSEMGHRSSVQSKRKRNISTHGSILRKREKNVETVKRGNGETSDSDLSLTGKPSLRNRSLLSSSSVSQQSRQYSSAESSRRVMSTKNPPKKQQSKYESMCENKALSSEKDNSSTSSHSGALDNSRMLEINRDDVSSSPKRKQKSRKSSSDSSIERDVNRPQNAKASAPRKNKNEAMPPMKNLQNKSALQSVEVECSNGSGKNLNTSSIRCQSLRKRNSIATPVSRQYPLEFYSNKIRSSIEKKNENSKISEQKKLSKKDLVTEKGNASICLATSKNREMKTLEKNPRLQGPSPSQTSFLKLQPISAVKKRNVYKEKTKKHELNLNLPNQKVQPGKTVQQHSMQKDRTLNFDEHGISSISEARSVVKTSEFRKDLSSKTLKKNSQIYNHKTKVKALTHSSLKEKESSGNVIDMSEPKKRKTNSPNFSEASNGNSNLRNRESLSSPKMLQLQRQYPEKYLSPKKHYQHLFKERKKSFSSIQGENTSDSSVQVKKLQNNKISVNKQTVRSSTNSKDDEKDLTRPKKTYSLPRKGTAAKHVKSRIEPTDQDFLLMKPQISMTIEAQSKSISSDHRRLKQIQKPTASVDGTVLRSPRKAQKRKLVEDLEVIEKCAEKQEVVLWCENGQTRSGFDITAYDIVLDSLLEIETSLLESEGDPLCQRVIKKVLGSVEKNIKSVISRTVTTKDLQVDLKKRKSRCRKLGTEIQEEEQVKTKCHGELHALASKRRESDLYEISKWMQEYSRLITTVSTP